jgi:hypothetical protein
VERRRVRDRGEVQRGRDRGKETDGKRHMERDRWKETEGKRQREEKKDQDAVRKKG